MRRTSASSTTSVCVALVLAAALLPIGGVRAAWRVVWERDGCPSSAGLSESRLVDLDADGSSEIVIVCRGEEGRGRVVAIDGNGEVRWEARVGAAAAVSLAGTGADGRPELAVAWGETLAVLRAADGERIRAWGLRSPRDPGTEEVAAGAPIRAIEVIEAGGGRLAVVVTGAERGASLAACRLDTLDLMWVLEAEREDGPFGRGFDHLSVGDPDGDGLPEILVTENMNRLLVIGPGGVVEWGVLLGEKSRFSPEGVASSPPVVADLTGDGSNEVAIGCFAGALVVLDGASGDELLRLRFGQESHRRLVGRRRLPAFLRRALESTGEPLGEAAVLELDRRAGCELVFGCSDGWLYAVSPRDGRTLWRRETPGDVYDAPALLADSGDGPCVLAWTSQGLVACEVATGEPRRMLDAAGGAAAVLVGDTTGNGRPEIVLVGRRGRRLTMLARSEKP